jgi:transcriptional regulator with XRE-family HTH domain
MAKPFRKLIENLPSERRERIRIKTGVLKNEMALHELRQALQLTQEELANTLKMKQTAISKFEHQSDIFISTLRKILFAMGADLKIVAHFPDGDVVINQFNDFLQDEPRRAQKG